METNAQLFAIVYEQGSIASMLKAAKESGIPQQQADYFFRIYEATSEQRIERLAASFRGEEVTYGPFRKLGVLK